MKKTTLIVITGPTASGKSALAVSLAHKLNSEIISADSRQIFKGIPIVTAVPTVEEREDIPHHLIEILNLEDYYSASLFHEDSLKIINRIFKASDTAIVCGGSMLYIDTLTNGIDDLPTIPDKIRNDLTNEWKNAGNEWLLNRLQDLDPVYYDKIDHRNLKRVFHAVEISIVAGVPYSSLLSGVKNKVSLPFNVLKFCMNGERETLFSRINSRVENMISNGLEEEAATVYPLRHLNSLNTVGLKEMFLYFDGKLNKAEAVARIQKNTRVYAKKQLTWHKRDSSIRYLDFSDSLSKNTDIILNHLLNDKS